MNIGKVAVIIAIGSGMGSDGGAYIIRKNIRIDDGIKNLLNFIRDKCND